MVIKKEKKIIHWKTEKTHQSKLQLKSHRMNSLYVVLKKINLLTNISNLSSPLYCPDISVTKNIITESKYIEKKKNQYLDSEFVNRFRALPSHSLRRRELICVIVVEESKTQKEDRNPVGEFETHASATQ